MTIEKFDVLNVARKQEPWRSSWELCHRRRSSRSRVLSIPPACNADATFRGARWAVPVGGRDRPAAAPDLRSTFGTPRGPVY